MTASVTLRGSGGSPLTDGYDTALLDLDGVVYVGPTAVAGAPEALSEARRRGMVLTFVTNNAARTPETVAGHLTSLGVAASVSEVVTSAQAAARLVSERVPARSPVLVVGGAGLVAALVERDLVPVASADEAPVAVVQGFSPDIGWALLAEGAYAVRRGVPWIASNLDQTIPTPRGIAPGNGTLVDVVAAATGRRPDAVAGKPQLALHREAVERSGAVRPLVVGDRLDTDIEGAVLAGTDSLLVFTGVCDATELLAAPPQHRPTYVGGTLLAMLEAHPVVDRAEDGAWACGGWSARVAGGVLLLEGAGDTYDGLRAACGASWTAADEGNLPDVSRAVARLGL
jgi:glycerol 3-phosphatase-2